MGDEINFFDWSALADLHQEISPRLAEAERVSRVPQVRAFLAKSLLRGDGNGFLARTGQTVELTTARRQR